MNSTAKTESQFATTLSNMRSAIPSRWKYQIETDPAFGIIDNGEGATLSFEELLFPYQFRWRMVHLQTPQTEMLNILVFPEPENIVPIFVTKLMTVGANSVVTSLDLDPIDRTTEVDSNLILSEAHQRFPDFVNEANTPDWYEHRRSGNDFYVQTESSNQMRQMQNVVESVWHRTLMVYSRVVTYPKISSLTQNMAKFKAHHLEHNPDRPLMHRLFGRETTETFLAQHLYR